MNNYSGERRVKRGPDQIIACPHCGGLAKHITLVSGNTTGVRVWTDGKQIAPMLPQPPPVVRCAHCAGHYWLGDAEQIGMAYLWRSGTHPGDPAWAAAPEAAEPDEAGYEAALAGGLAEDTVQERNLRILAWWRHNDTLRDDPGDRPGSGELSAAFRENAERLMALLEDEDDSDRLMRAELLRELGRFDQAARCLDSITTEEVEPIVRRLRTLCASGDSRVREITANEYGERIA